MENLLRWGLQNSDTSAAPPGQVPPEPRTDLDPAILDAILGKPDSELMKEALTVAVDEERSEEERLTALDDFEMLVEQIDNANSITTMNMWTPLQTLLTTTTTDSIKTNTLWVIGTAVQNNPAAQKAYLSLPTSPLPSILSLLSSTHEYPATRSKSVYALSGLLKHNAEAVRNLEDAGGWDILCEALQDPDITVRRKVAFLLNALLLPSSPSSSSDQSQSHPTAAGPVHPNSHASLTVENSDTADVALDALEKHSIVEAAASALINPLPHGSDGEHEGDIDFTEKLVRLLYNYFTAGRPNHLDDKRKTEVREWLEKQRSTENHLDLGQEELKTLIERLS